MRNLKKILALVLALVMSLSLMATAGAASFQDVTDDNPYKTAIDVLDQLKVFQGFEDGSFKPTDTLNRAQAAVLVYRIATGDVEGKQVENYTYMAQSKFVDLDGYNWAKGYINYCQNAKIVVGTDATHFNPGGQVTGYQLMVMLLRTLGYGAAGEFTDPKGWELETAKIAEREGILKNVTGGDFGAAAPRQMVAEILFRGLLTETVTYSALTSGGYTKTGETLGKRELSLEELEGVVMANEYASLTSSVTAKDGKTELLSDGKTYTLNTTTTLDDIGENRHAYIQNSTVLYMEDVGNTTEESTDAEKVSDILSRAGIADGGENFVNFDRLSTWTSPWKIKYEVNLGPVANLKTPVADGIARIAAAVEDGRDLGFILPDATTFDRDGNPTAFDPDLGDGEYSLVASADGSPYKFDLVYSKSFKIRQEIGPVHQSNIELIFNIADEDSKGYIDGEVYYGTSSLDDASDELTLEQFIEKCIDDTYDVNIKSNDNGNWVKVIDNNGDGVAEYIFKVIYTVAQVSNKKDDKVTLDTKNRTLWSGSKACEADELNNLTSQPVVANDEMDKDDIVYYAIIDGKAQTYMTEKVTATIEKVDHNKLIATTTDGTPYTQSDVHEHIEDEAYASGVSNLAGKISYDLFLDRGGYLAAFVKPEASNLVLITDGWFNQLKNSKEYAVKVYNDETGEIDIVDLTSNGGLFIHPDNAQNNGWNGLKFFGGVDEDAGYGYHDGYWRTATINFDEGAIDNAPSVGKLNGNGTVTHTIVASVSEDGTILPVENSSVTGRYQRNILDLLYTDDQGEDHKAIPGKAAEKATVYATLESSDTKTAYNGGIVENVEVRALNDTVYYVVYKGNVVSRTVGYSKAPKLDDLKDSTNGSWVEDIYAVGTLHEADNNLSKAYYTADVVVVELNYYDHDYEVVFVVDDTARDDKVNYRRVALIHEDGTLEEDVRIDWTGNTQGYSDNADRGKRIQPGFYQMRAAGKDTYTLSWMDSEDIRDEGCIAVGQIDLSKDLKDKTFIATHDWNLNTIDRDKDGLGANASDYDAAYVAANTDANEYDITNDTKLYKLAYGEWKTTTSWRNAGYPVVSDIDTVLDGRVNEVDSDSRYADSREDNYKPYANRQDVNFNYNDVMVFYSSGKAVYAVSFENFVDNTSTKDWAQYLWESIIPAAKEKTGLTVVNKIEGAVVDTINGTAAVLKDGVYKASYDQDGYEIVITAADTDAAALAGQYFATWKDSDGVEHKVEATDNNDGTFTFAKADLKGVTYVVLTGNDAAANVYDVNVSDDSSANATVKYDDDNVPAESDDPASVEIKHGETVTIEAEDGYYVSKVEFNDEEQTIAEDGKYAITGNTTIKVTTTSAKIAVSVVITDENGNTVVGGSNALSGEANYGDSFSMALDSATYTYVIEFQGEDEANASEKAFKAGETIAIPVTVENGVVLAEDGKTGTMVINVTAKLVVVKTSGEDSIDAAKDALPETSLFTPEMLDHFAPNVNSTMDRENNKITLNVDGAITAAYVYEMSELSDSDNPVKTGAGNEKYDALRTQWWGKNWATRTDLSYDQARAYNVLGSISRTTNGMTGTPRASMSKLALITFPVEDENGVVDYWFLEVTDKDGDITGEIPATGNTYGGDGTVTVVNGTRTWTIDISAVITALS